MSFVKRHTQIITLVILTLAGPASAATPAAATGKVVSVHDGDTLTVRTEAGETLKIRLHGIDAPEAKQAFGTVARKALGDLIAGKTVSVEEVDRDRYGSVVGRVTIAGKLVNA